MAREDIFAMRVSPEERKLIEHLAAHEERTPSDTVRRILRDRARQLGLVPAAPKEDRHVANVAT